MQSNNVDNETTIAEQREQRRVERAEKIQRDRELGGEVVTFSKEERAFAKKMRGFRREATKAMEQFRGGFGSDVPERFAGEIQSLCQDLRAAKSKLDILAGKDDEE